MSLAALVPEAWRSALAEVSLAPLEVLLARRARRGAAAARANIFAALQHVRPDDIKVVLVGQDPYPTVGNANGLAFSVSPGTKVPASLRNVFAALE